MSLNLAAPIANPTDELLKLNLRGTINLFADGQTISYSFLTAEQTAIFDGYKTAYGENISNSGELWGTTSWSDDVRTAVRAAKEIIDLDFTETTDIANSDLRWVAAYDINSPSGPGIIGYSYLTPSFDMDNDDGDNNIYTGQKDAGILIYDKSPYHSGVKAEAELGGGNERTTTILHEFGHFLGLSHPHTGSDADSAPFVELNDGKYDIMSYNYSDDNRKIVVNGVSISSTYNFGTYINFSPINIAALQHLYGSNTNTHTGGTAYYLTDAGTEALDVNGNDGRISIGRAYYTIWDNTGFDEIRYKGNNRVLLNLNAATLDRTTNDADLIETLNRVAGSNYYNTLYGDYRTEITDSKYYAGGFFSQILTNDDSASFGVNFGGKYANTLGGFTIANGVVIENATGGNGNDLIIGNAAANILTGNNGNDTIFDGNGHDTSYGGSGNDIFYVGKGNDTYYGGSHSDRADFNSAVGNYQIFVVGTTVTIQDIFGSTYGSNIFYNVEIFTFTSGNLTIANLPTTTEYERLYADLLNNDLVTDLGGINGNTNDTFWGDDNANTFHADLLNDLYNGADGQDIAIFKGDKVDFSFSIGNGSELIVTSQTDATSYDVLHSIEQLNFDDMNIDVDDASFATDLGLSSGDFTTWLSNYDFS